MRNLRLAAKQFSAILVLAALLLPAVGPLMDHHFAERQPGHLHVGASGYHEHTHAYEHAHDHSHDKNADGHGYPVVIYNYEGGPAAITVLKNANTDMDSFLKFEPGSIFILPSRTDSHARNNYISPPGKPPQGIL